MLLPGAAMVASSLNAAILLHQSRILSPTRFSPERFSLLPSSSAVTLSRSVEVFFPDSHW